MLNEGYKVSVIMPVYNAQEYIERAVKSVVNLPNTGELIMIDDASSDQSLQISRDLEKDYKQIQVLTHADNKNRGAAETRNVGIRHSKFDYISFLDADDYYLPNRFDKEAEIFSTDPEVDAVYGFTLAEYESANAKKIFEKGIFAERTTFSEKVLSKDLFKALMLGGYGYFHTSGITIKKSLLEKTGLFNPAIRYVEDTELWYKLSLTGNLAPGSIYEPIAIRWVHENNSIHQTENIKPYRRLMYHELFNWAISRPFSFEVKNLFFMALHRYGNEYRVSALNLLLQEAKKNPVLFSSIFFYKKLHLILKSSGKN